MDSSTEKESALPARRSQKTTARIEEIRRPVRGAIAIDMEGAIFYRTVADFPGLHSLLVKGVCDYADTEKDDSYHEYASAISAIYTLCFIKEYVTTTLIPDTHRE